MRLEPITAPGDDVGVAVEIFGGAVQDQVEAVFDWPKVDRRCERVVDQRDEPLRPGELDDRLEVGDLQSAGWSLST